MVLKSILLLLAIKAAAAPVRFEVIHEKSTIAVRTDKSGLLSGVAGHRHGIIAGEFTARVCAVAVTLGEASVSVRIPTAALRIDTEGARTAAHLPASGPSAKDIPTIQEKMLSRANLGSAEHPEIRFESTAAERRNDVISLRGTLTIRGRSHPVSVPLRLQQAGGDYRLSGEFPVRQSDFGITPESIAGVVKVSDQVTIVLDLLARPTQQPCQP